MIEKSRQFNSRGGKILIAKLIFKPIIQNNVGLKSEVRQRLGYNEKGEYQIHANNKEDLPCSDLAEYLIKQEFILPMISKRGKISHFEKYYHNQLVVYAFEPNLGGLNLRIRGASAKEMDLNKTLDIRALDSFIAYGYVSEK